MLHPVDNSIGFSSTYFVDSIEVYLLDSTIRAKKCYPLDNLLGFIVTYPMDGDLSAQ